MTIDNPKYRNPKYQNANDRTLDLFAAAPPTEGDGAATHQANAHVVRTALADVDMRAITVHRDEPFRVPGLGSPVLPVPVFSLRLVRERDHLTRQITTPDEAARVACELLEGFDREVFLVLALSTSGRLIGAHLAHTGTVDASIASPREALKFCLLVNARSFLVAHNHPSGSLEPSRADVQATKQMQAAGEAVGIPLRDSLVCGFDGCYTSLAERGLIDRRMPSGGAGPGEGGTSTYLPTRAAATGVNAPSWET